MPGGSDDVRKKFILTTSENFYGLKPSSALVDCKELNNFLDDGNQFILSVSIRDTALLLSDKVTQRWNSAYSVYSKPELATRLMDLNIQY